MNRLHRIQKTRMSRQWDKLESHAREMLSQEPDSVYLIQLVGESLEKQGRPDEALDFYEKTLEIDDQQKHRLGHTFFLKRLDIIYNRAGRYNDCLRVGQYYTARHPDCWDAWNRLWRASVKTGNTEIGDHAKKRAEEIKQQQEKRKRSEETRNRRSKVLYESKLQELGFDPHETVETKLERLKNELAPAPDLDASGDEWR